MSVDTNTPPSQQYDSALDRRRLRDMLEVLQRDLTAHIGKDETLTESISTKLDGLREYQIRIRTVVAMALLMITLGGGALAWGGKMVIKQAVSEAMPKPRNWYQGD